MNMNFFKYSLLVGASMAMVACGANNTSGQGSQGSHGPAQGEQLVVEDAIAAPLSTLTQDLQDLISFMYSEESLAHDVYLAIYEVQPMMQLQNIATKSEVQHIDAVDQLAIKYDLNMTQYPDTDVPYSTEGIGDGKYPVEAIQELYDMLYDKGIASQKDALEVGCIVEVVDVEDLTGAIALAQEADAGDVEAIFNFLRDGSYKHYWAFDKGLKNLGIEGGCCAMDDFDGYSLCHPEYPQN